MLVSFFNNSGADTANNSAILKLLNFKFVLSL